MAPVPFIEKEHNDVVPAAPAPGFEGPEKRLEIYFRPLDGSSSIPNGQGFRKVARNEWSDILLDAQCSILSVKSNGFFDAYLLSESSLFVYDNKIMIKTCGTTTLLRVIPRLLRVAQQLGIEMDYLQYSRASFTFPHQQLHPHTSFQSEVDYLNNFFHGESYVLGTSDGATQWHLYISGECRIRTADQGFEVFMFDLDQECMKHFFNLDEKGVLSIGSAAGTRTSEACGISKLVGPSAVIDAYNFDPCGYSMNGLEDSSYYTIHITPEPHCSYVSFECTLPLPDFTTLLQNVLETFRPKKFSVAIHADLTAPASINGLKASMETDFAWPYCPAGDSTFLRMKTTSGHEVCATVCSYVTYDEIKNLCGLKLHSPKQLKSYHSSIREVSSKFNAHGVKVSMALKDIAVEAIRQVSTNKPICLVDLSLARHRIDEAVSCLNVLKRGLRCSVRLVTDPALLRLFDSVGCTFEASSVQELELLSDQGIDSSNVIMGNPILALNGHSKSLVERLGCITLFDDMDESTIRSLGESFRGSDVELRLMDPLTMSSDYVAVRAEKAFRTAISSGLSPVSLRFELCENDGSDPLKLRTALEVAHKTICCFLRPGCAVRMQAARNLRRLSIGSCFPGVHASNLAGFLSGLQVTSGYIDEFFPSSGGVTVSVDPCRFVLSSTCSLILSVIARRDLREGNCVAYYVNDGVFGSFRRLLKGRDYASITPVPLVVVDNGDDDYLEPCEVLGPTCEEIDRLWSGVLPRLHVGDSLLYPGTGAFAPLDSTKHSVWYFVRE